MSAVHSIAECCYTGKHAHFPYTCSPFTPFQTEMPDISNQTDNQIAVFHNVPIQLLSILSLDLYFYFPKCSIPHCNYVFILDSSKEH